jgi:20S proteasome alpha/beta subunit
MGQFQFNIDFPRKVVYYSTLNIKKGEEPLTIIVGIICKNGIVLGCDSQATSAKGVPLKRTEYTKIYEIALGSGGCALLSGAGTGAFITRASEILADKCKDSVCRTAREFADICEDVVNEIFKRYVIDRAKAIGMGRTKTPKDIIMNNRQWQEDISEEPPIIMLAGIRCGNDKDPEWGLYTIHPSAIAEKTDKYDAIGSGSAIAEYLLARLWNEELTVEQAINVVVYIIEEVKKIDPFCGGPTQIMALSKTGINRLKPSEVKAVADKVMGQDDQLAKFWRQLVVTPGEQTSAKGKG